MLTQTPTCNNSLISSEFNQEIWCKLLGLLFWFISTYCVFKWLHWLGLKQCTQSYLCNKVALSTSVCHYLWIFWKCVSMSMTHRNTHTERKTCLDTVISWLYLSIWARAWLCQHAPLVRCATLQWSVSAQTWPQLRYGNRCYNLYVALI